MFLQLNPLALLTLGYVVVVILAFCLYDVLERRAVRRAERLSNPFIHSLNQPRNAA